MTKGGNKTFIGFDTETINNGQIVIIANSNKEFLLEPNLDELLEFLLEYSSNNYLGYFYNLDYDTKSIIMTIAEQNNQIDDIKNFIYYQHLAYKDYTISYIPGKKLSIFYKMKLKEVKYKDKYGNWHKRNAVTYERKSEYYDISQFYLNKYGKIMKLEQASKEYLGYGKFEVEDIGNIDMDRFRNDKNYCDELVRYCIRDSFLVKKLCYVFYNQIKDYINSKKMLSPAYISQKYILKNLKEKGIKNEFTNKFIMRYEKEILNSYYGGRFETFKKGIMDNDKGYLADINSAYPFIMSQFHGLTGQATLTKDSDLELEKCYPLINISLSPTDLYLNPLPFKTDSNLVYFPSNKKTITKWIPQWSIKLLDLMGVDYSINKIIKFWKTDNLIFDFIHELYRLKKEEPKYTKIAKIILNSMYGKTIERTNRIVLTDNDNSEDFMIIGKQLYFIEKVKGHRGTLYNPLWSTMITDFCRYYVVEPLIKNNLVNNIYQIATDSILLNKKPQLDYGKNIGQWSIDEISKPIIYGNGILQYNDTFKSRGFSCTNDNGEPDINKFHEILKTKKFIKQQIIPMHYYNKFGFQKLHSFQKIQKNFSIIDKKRLFADIEPMELMNTMIDSKPLVLN